MWKKLLLLCLLLTFFEGMCVQNCETLEELNAQVVQDFEYINHPLNDWNRYRDNPPKIRVLDVAIVGGGYCGLTVAATMVKEHMYNFKVFDQNPAGSEGPWATFARMKNLRSEKKLMGPAMGIPSLTFRAWYETVYGKESWETFYFALTPIWMEYLSWYKQVLRLPVENEHKLISISPVEEGFLLEFDKPSKEVVFVLAKKVVLATGRKGFGGAKFPSYVKNLPRESYAHSSEVIDFEPLKGKKIAVVGSGASAFDATAVALEKEAASVDLLIRRKRLEKDNYFKIFSYPSYIYSYGRMDDNWRWNCIMKGMKQGTPPPACAVRRLEGWANLSKKMGYSIDTMSVKDGQVLVESAQGNNLYDFVIFATGFNVNGAEVPEIAEMFPDIALWEDRMPSEIVQQDPTLGHFPYLGANFEFLEKHPGQAPYLKHLHCFNFGALLSQGMVCSEIPGVSVGAQRLVEGFITDKLSRR